MTINYQFGDVDAHGAMIRAQAASLEAEHQAIVRDVLAAGDFWGGAGSVACQEFITQLGRNFQVIYEQANAHGQKVQAAGNNMAQTVASTMATSMVLDAIEQAIWTRQQEGVLDLKDVIHHTDRGSQYTSIRFSERLAEAGIQPSVGAVGSSYDNALAETINGLYKTELIKPGKPWRSIEDVELATARWVDWFNHRRLYQYCGDVPPVELEAAYYAQRQRPAAG